MSNTLQCTCARCKKDIKPFRAHSMGKGIFGFSYYICGSCYKIWDRLFVKHFGSKLQNIMSKTYKKAWEKLFLEKFLITTKEHVVFT